MSKRKINRPLVFFEIVSAWLQDAIIGRCVENNDYWRISGYIKESRYCAKISIVYNPDNLRIEVPIVFCHEEWIRRDLDWHCFRSYSESNIWGDLDRLCWIHPKEWRLANDYSEKSLWLVINEGSEWLKNNITKLLDRHWIGHTLGLISWKKEWSGWLHGEKGTAEFLNELKRQGHPVNWQKT